MIRSCLGADYCPPGVRDLGMRRRSEAATALCSFPPLLLGEGLGVRGVAEER